MGKEKAKEQWVKKEGKKTGKEEGKKRWVKRKGRRNG